MTPTEATAALNVPGQLRDVLEQIFIDFKWKPVKEIPDATWYLPPDGRRPPFRFAHEPDLLAGAEAGAALFLLDAHWRRAGLL